MERIGFSILKSPVLHFVVLGIAVFELYTWLKRPQLETIHITTQTIEALIRQQENLQQHPLTEAQKQAVIAGHVENEILLREAYKRGLDKNDYRVRKRLLSVMRSSLNETVPDPSVAQLRAFYNAHRKRFETPPSRSFEHVYFSFVKAQPPPDPALFVQQLQSALDISSLGEYFQMGQKFSKMSFRQIAQRFGKPFAEHVFGLPLRTWTGPIESRHGFHYLRVTRQHDPEVPPFEALESYLRSDYVIQKTRDGQGRKIEQMRKNYRIIVNGMEPKT